MTFSVSEEPYNLYTMIRCLVVQKDAFVSISLYSEILP